MSKHQCPNCQREEGFKPQRRYGIGERPYQPRATCRFCGHIRRRARA